MLIQSSLLERVREAQQ
jgi:hypothetical protein